MSGKRIVQYVETECETSCFDRHVYCGEREAERRQLDPGQYVLIEKEDGEWPEWATAAAAYGATGYPGIFDALVDATREKR